VEGDVTIQQKLDLTALQPGALPPAGGAVARRPAGNALAGRPGAVTPAEAAKRGNETGTLEMTVRSARKAHDRSRVSLNSEERFRDAANFTVVLDMRKAAEGLKAAGGADPLAYYRGKTVLVTGTVTLFRDSPQIVVEDAGQIAVVEK